MANGPELDLDKYKPSHEKTDPQTAIGKATTKNFIQSSLQFKKSTDRRYAKREGKRCIDTNIFVPLDPSEPINGKEGAKQNKAILTVVVGGSIWLLLMFKMTEKVKELTSLPLILVLVLELLLGVIILYSIMAKFILKLEDKRLNESRARGNKLMSMSSVWGINPGGIHENELNNRPHTSVYYSGKEAIVLKVLKKSVLVTSDTADWDHYDSLRRVEDLLIKNGFIFSKFNTEYDTNNDYIWDELDNNLAVSATIYGEDYSNIMKQFLTFQKKQTEAISSVTVVYFVIMPELIAPKIPYNRLIQDIKSLLSSARCQLGTISNKEFLRLLKNYYGLEYLNLEQIIEGISAMNDSPVEVSTIRLVDSDGKLIELKELFSPRISDYYAKPVGELKEKPFKERRGEDVFVKGSIFGDKVINQSK